MTCMESSTIETEIVRWVGEACATELDVLAVEEPLEIRLAGCSVAVTMRTPGDDFDLASGFLLTEGILHSAEDIGSIAYCPTENMPRDRSNVVNINPTDPLLVDPERWRRNFFATSSCGICGKESIRAVRQDAPPITSEIRVPYEALGRMSSALRAAQTAFSATGGLHAAGLFDVDGQLLTVREDVGRHNTVDKIIGDALRQGLLPLSRNVLLVSGRASFEVMQKALMAQIPIVVAVSAPSSLAVELARSSNMTLAGFLRQSSSGCRFNLYAGAQRIVPSSPDHSSCERTAVV